MACYPWIVPFERQQQQLEDFPHLQRWFNAIFCRSAVSRAYLKGQPFASRPTVNEESHQILFGQTAKTVENHSESL